MGGPDRQRQAFATLCVPGTVRGWGYSSRQIGKASSLMVLSLGWGRDRYQTKRENIGVRGAEYSAAEHKSGRFKKGGLRKVTR